MIEAFRLLRDFLLLIALGSLAFCYSPNCSIHKTGSHRCSSGDCIELSELCDGRADCLDASDETKDLCEKMWCPSYSFRCNYGACIASTAVCDGQSDCIDGSDEQHWLCRAQMEQANCDNFEFYCYPGQCLSYDKLCDGKFDCPNGDDEAESLCVGVSTSTTPFPATKEEITVLKNQTSFCVIPQLTLVIIQNKSSDSVLHMGSRVPDGTVIYFDCPADHVLRGAFENRCEASKWLNKFPYCESPISWALFAIIALIAIVILVLVSLILIYSIYKKKNNRQLEEHIWLVESRNAQTNVEIL